MDEVDTLHAERRAATRRLSLWLAVSISAAACGQSVMPSRDARADVVVAIDGNDAAVDASRDLGVDVQPDPCDGGVSCSRIVDRTGCLGPTTLGSFCDSLATPCSTTPPDCNALGAALGMMAMPSSCGAGLSNCVVDWTGTVDSDLLDRLCAGRAAIMQPVDCVLN
jgi:hypothetical protein